MTSKDISFQYTCTATMTSFHLDSITGFSLWSVSLEEGVWVTAVSPPPPFPKKLHCEILFTVGGQE